MSKITVTVELDYETVDKVIYAQLVDTRDTFLSDIESYKNGKHANIFFWGEPEKDIEEIQKHIDALNIVIECFRIPGYEV
jgi:hypothetical protein